jgi:hypothetical protein
MNDSRTEWKSYLSLFGSILIMLAVPILGMKLGAYALDKDPFFSKCWRSKYDVAGRSWLFAAFCSTFWITGTLVSSFVADDRFNAVRHGTQFSSYVKGIIRYTTLVMVIGIILVFLPTSWAGGVWSMKGLALATALFMWWIDSKILKIVADKNPELKTVFRDTVRLIDIPTAGAVAFVIVLAALYIYVFLPHDTKSSDFNEVFVMGLSCGAVAVELWFANLLFWILGREAS